MRFYKGVNMEPQYVGHYKVIARVEKVEYRLELPDELILTHQIDKISKSPVAAS